MMLRHDKLPPIPETPRPLPDGPLYFVGVGGAGMSSLAQILAERGRDISGADPGISSVVRARLEKVGIRVFTGHNAAQLPEGVGAVVVSDAVPETNPEVLAAQAQNVPIFRRPEVLGALVNAGRGIAIAGTHGKTTTTGMVASILLAANLDPTIILGGDLPQIGGNARNGKSDIVLAESCEAYDGFLYLHPEIAVILNIEADHLDYHGTEQHVFDSFARFAKQVNGSLFVCGEDKNVELLTGSSTKAGPFTAKDTGRLLFTYGFNNDTFQAYDIKTDGPYTRFSLRLMRHRELDITLHVPGLHNVLNATVAAAVAFALEVEPKYIKAGLEAFTGTGRRFEKLGEKNGVLVVDDYAHHPTELRATLSAARSAYPDRRIVAVFQPHLPSRTRDNMDAFADALTLADTVYLTDIYLAREAALPGVSSEILAARVRENKPELNVVYVPNKADLPIRLAAEAKAGDLVLTLGAGDIRAAGEGLLNRL